MQVSLKPNYTTERKGLVITYYTLKISTGENKKFHAHTLNVRLSMDPKGCVKP